MLVEYEFESGETVLIEIKSEYSQGWQQSSTTIEKAQKKFEEAISAIKPVASAVIDKVRTLSDPPDKIEVEFGLNLTAQGGAVIASTGIEAGFKVTLVWEPTKDD